LETVSGQQAQMDWGECGTIDVDGERRKLYVFVLVLGYSRVMYARFTTSSKLPVLLACMSRAFQALGIPAEVLVDNMKQAVDQHDVSTGTVRWNKQFLDYAAHHGFLPIASPPYWPRVKGKVERGVGYIKASFLEGRSFSSLGRDLLREAAEVEDDERRGRLMKWAVASHSAARMRAAVELAGGIPRLIVEPDDLDRYPWLLGVRNGVVHAFGYVEWGSCGRDI
jgi:transposase